MIRKNIDISVPRIGKLFFNGRKLGKEMKNKYKRML